ncbi:hypothetical protein A3B42_03220 [Candidatus Daviesbacteria bacterium RIFCSPLOWO2_01_FULL_38_10]|nr:MAG: Peptidase family M49 [Candidatus Daviesbacteria bacterium GW2011_GWA2_38_17]OGE27249.1 MAG: hypothetical protein A3D02_03015 [Candidatus Daviesbacteria bacterium RIFCSPHIGHO2_02_FULL_39_41]OGE27753.1 MAG: hypothetical protein A2772_00700 [Candidatus Daviesbacteria bacterium RIFCSPHIGHO2_01_FULL_38_8b]OGE38790.1 MAG: hypothetical protein A3B42_03220 [Candidatus Daviesbacteria bacterium RIFCSPLOWO2_01_FULL_38_10]OGE44975.1 MAG: hypothetical protein A3E67_02325 [Candidatus Daviesbacteria b
MSDLPLLEFNPKLPKLSKNERKVLDLLVEAGKLIAPIYLEQEKQAKNDSFSSSPYTVVEKVKGKLVATPYHVKYAKLLKPVAEKLEEAAKVSDNKQFANALKVQAKALLDGTYEKAIATWLKMPPYILDISIGPVVYFDEQLFFAKASYQAWVGVINEKRTKRLKLYEDVALATHRKALIPGERIEENHLVKSKVDDVLLFSGLMARTKFIGVNLPNDLQWVKKYGSEITLFENANDFRMEEQIIPAFNKFFSPGFRQGFSREDLRRASLRYVALHEIAHSYLYYKNAFTKLQDLLPALYELSATVLGMRIAGSLLVKDIITDKQLVSMFVTFICRSFYLIEQYKKTKFMGNYALGGVIFINFMLENGALKQYKGLAIPNFVKMFVSLHDLFYILEKLLSSGTRKDAVDFIKKYGKLTDMI